VEEIGHDSPVVVVLDRTPFYGESGGQVGDIGLLTGEGFTFEVIDTQREGGFVLHLGHLRSGSLQLGATVQATVDVERRSAIRRAHSATHILHYALQKHLGGHAQQQGSKVDGDWLRFDFTHPKSVGPDELASIEDDVNSQVVSSAPITWTNIPMAEARNQGAMMLFGEKYPDVVRMVSMGDFSKELCGGTHLDNTAQVGLFKIVGEESVAAGTRRITALTGRGALAHVRKAEALLHETAAALKVPVTELPQRVEAMAKELRTLRKQASAGTKSGVSVETLLADAVEQAGIRVVAAEVPGANANILREHIDQLRRKASPIAVMLGCREGEKVLLVAGISRELEQKGASAVEWVRDAAHLIGGSGGGRADMAQAGGKHPDKLPEALAEALVSAKKRF